MTDDEKKTIMDDGYIPNDYAATPFSDAIYLPDENDCPDGLDNKKWKETIKNIKPEIDF